MALIPVIMNLPQVVKNPLVLAMNTARGDGTIEEVLKGVVEEVFEDMVKEVLKGVVEVGEVEGDMLKADPSEDKLDQED